MKESKHIDRLFQEKFKDFEAPPSDAVWQRIAASRNKKDRKIIPLWLWRLGGVAALILLLVTINNLWINPSASGNEVVDTENQKTEASIENNGFKDNENGITNGTTQPSSEKDNVSGTDERQENALKGITANDQNTGAENALQSNKNGTTVSNETIVTTTEERETPVRNFRQNDITNNKQTGTADAIVYEKETPSEVTRLPEEEQLTKSVFPDEGQAISTSGQTTIAASSEEKTAAEETALDLLENTKSLVEEAQRIAEAQEEEDQIINEGNSSRWDVGAVAAPVFYGDFGGSGIDPQFSDNSKSRNANLSYGVQVSYAVNDKLKIRSGVSNVDLSYSTNDIAFTPGNLETALASQRALGGVDFNDRSAAIIVLDNRNLGQQQALSPSDFPGGGGTVSNGSLIQSLNYYEIPVEAVYVLSDKRLGVELIGGLSTLLLNNDQIELESEGARTTIGTSNAVNGVSFTTNVGVGVNYKLSDKLKVNLEPSLKYQLNAFDDSSGDFRPYIVGLYTGLSYRF